MPPEADTPETTYLIDLLSRHPDLVRYLYYHSVADLEQYFDPLDDRAGPDVLYDAFIEHNWRFDRVDWDTIYDELGQMDTIPAVHPLTPQAGERCVRA